MVKLEGPWQASKLKEQRKPEGINRRLDHEDLMCYSKYWWGMSLKY